MTDLRALSNEGLIGYLNEWLFTSSGADGHSTPADLMAELTRRLALASLVPGLAEAEGIVGELLENSDMVWVPYGYNDRADFEYYKCRYCGKKCGEDGPAESHCTNPACPAVRARAWLEVPHAMP